MGRVIAARRRPGRRPAASHAAVFSLRESPCPPGCVPAQRRATDPCHRRGRRIRRGPDARDQLPRRGVPRRAAPARAARAFPHGGGASERGRGSFTRRWPSRLRYVGQWEHGANGPRGHGHAVNGVTSGARCRNQPGVPLPPVSPPTKDMWSWLSCTLTLRQPAVPDAAGRSVWSGTGTAPLRSPAPRRARCRRDHATSRPCAVSPRPMPPRTPKRPRCGPTRPARAGGSGARCTRGSGSPARARSSSCCATTRRSARCGRSAKCAPPAPR